jgi:hypothetical protein
MTNTQLASHIIRLESASVLSDSDVSRLNSLKATQLRLKSSIPSPVINKRVVSANKLAYDSMRGKNR